jgi:hypothetical protein
MELLRCGGTADFDKLTGEMQRRDSLFQDWTIFWIILAQ